MEVFAKYGTEEQKRRWLDPLLRGEIRSAFLMTEPGVASSDATNIELRMHKEGNEYVLNGQVSSPQRGESHTGVADTGDRNGGAPARATAAVKSTL